MSSSWLQNYCNDSFWDADQTWFTDEPRISRCFRQTVLTLPPYLLLWLLVPFEISLIVRKKKKRLAWNSFNVTRCFICVALIALQALEFSSFYTYFLSDDHGLSGITLSDVFAALIKLFTHMLLLVIFLFHRTYGIITSGITWTFLFILVSFQIISVADAHLHNQLAYSYIEHCTLIASFTLSCVLLILCSFVDGQSNEEAQLYNENENKLAFSLSEEHQKILKKIDQDRKPSPEAQVSFFSRITYSWLTPIIVNGYKQPLVAEQLWSLKPADKISQIVCDFSIAIKKYLQLNAKRTGVTPQVDKHVLLRAIINTLGIYFLIGSFFKFIFDLLQFVNPQLLKLLISFAKESEEKRWHGLLIAITMLLSATLQSILINIYFQRMFLIAMKVRSAIINLIYRKALRLSATAKRNRTTGEIVNLLSVDTQRFTEIFPYLNLIWSAPFQIICSIYFLYQQLGVSVFAGVGVILIMIPINAVIVNSSKKMQIKQMRSKDERVKLVNEMLNGIRVLKLYGWEKPFLKNVFKVRNEELGHLRNFSYLSIITMFFFAAAPLFVSLSTFFVYVMIDERNELTAEKAFVSLALFNVLQFPLNLLPQLINNIIMASVSLKRISSFLCASELTSYVTREHDQNNALDIGESINFEWESAEDLENSIEKSKENSSKNELDKSIDTVADKLTGKPIPLENNFALRNINLKVKKQSLVAIVGGVGCGKSSLLNAILGDMNVRNAKPGKAVRVNISDELRIAYAPQQAWIQNASVKDNILFGAPFDKHRYEHVLDACALRPDLQLLPAGDATEIGEKGINLSGGQKQRVSLARLCYSNSDLVLLDDPLSAVDAHVAKHLFKHVLRSDGGMLAKCTRLLVTNQLSVLKHVDQILVLEKGRIVLNCNYTQLLQEAQRHGVDGLKRYGIKLEEENTEEKEQATKENETRDRSKSIELSRSVSVGKTSEQLTGRLIDNEKVEKEQVKLSDYKSYIRNCGYYFFTFSMLSLIAQHALNVLSNVWLSIWSSDVPNSSESQQSFNLRNLSIYGLLAGFQCIILVISFFFLVISTLKAAERFHSSLLVSIIRSPMSFFDTTPMGRIVNRFSRDIDTVDSQLPSVIRMFSMCFLRIVGTFVVILYQTPLFFFVLTPIIFIYYYVQKMYVASTRQLKRLESITRSPIYSHFSETLSGCNTIRAFGKVNAFVAESNAKVELNNICYYPSILANRWLSIRLENLGNLLVFSTSMFAVYNKETLGAGTVGLIISYAMSLTQILSWQVRMISELETNLVSVERINEYTRNEQEDEWEKDTRPPADWPSKGEITIENYSTCYRKGMEPVLRDLSLQIEPLHKIGIVGRTGAGKSTITLALFRIIEPTGGNICIDGVDITTIGLHDLRSKLSIIPQDPVLFSGTVRFNLDPFDEHTDEQIWKVLELAHLKDFVKGLPTGLLHQINEAGENLSVGQRQLVCLARALLKNSKILILDEATASVDYVTDSLIQETIRKEFSNATTITIAHRINTIMDSTKILVLDQGRLQEYDEPQTLLQNSNSMFSSLVKSAQLEQK